MSGSATKRERMGEELVIGRRSEHSGAGKSRAIIPGIALFSLAILALLQSLSAAEIDESKLPPPAETQVDFARDIKPIFQAECLRCHSGERPKSNYRLTSREEALKGGNDGLDILPGQSARSPLIHYVARLIPDLEMPPDGKGHPLTGEQIGLLRAWIDQGVSWETNAPEPKFEFLATPIVGFTSVSGDSHKFRELYWQREDWNGGLDEFEMLAHPSLDSKLTVSGRFLLDDYKVSLESRKNELGFVRFGWSQYRKYFDDTGGFYPGFATNSFSLNRDSHEDIGKASVDLGLTLPNLPSIVLGYEYQYRAGNESTLQWGPVSDGTTTKNIYPGNKEVSERVNILKLDLGFEREKFSISDNVRLEWYDLSTRRLNGTSYTLGTTNISFADARESTSYLQGANTFHVDGQLTSWLFASGGYLYSKLTEDSSMNVSYLNPAALDLTLPSWGWQAPRLELERESHVFSLSTRVGPWQGLSLSLGVQQEWTRQTGVGTASNSLTLPFGPIYENWLGIENMFSDLDRSILTREAALRFTKIPFTTLHAEGRWQTEDLGQYEQETGSINQFMRHTDASTDLKDLRAGFNTSPWTRVSLSGRYRHYESETDYDHLLKKTGEGYPAFLRWRESINDEYETKLALNLASWLKTGLSYQYRATDYHVASYPVTTNPATSLPADITSGNNLQAGTYAAHIASFNATLTPWQRAFLSSTFSYENARTVTAANGSDAVAPYAGDIYSVIFSGTYALDAKTSLSASYSFSSGDFTQDGLTAGLATGIDYHQHSLQAALKRQLNKNTSVGFQYRFYRYDEPSSAGKNDFEAHAFFATLSLRLP
jgi:hypothetical protein